MTSFTYTIKKPVGLHARHAGLLVKEASGYSSAVTVTKDGRTVDAKRIFGLMNLGIKTGEPLVFTLEGPEEQAEANKLRDFLFTNF